MGRSPTIMPLSPGTRLAHDDATRDVALTIFPDAADRP